MIDAGAAIAADDHGCIFVHIPGTVGSSIEGIIWPGSRNTNDLWMGA